MAESFETRCEILKSAGEPVGFDMGLVFGWGIITHEGDVPYVDTQNHHIPQVAMLKASCDFAKNSRETDEMHEGDADGVTVFLFPLTDDLCKAFKITCPRRGLLVGAMPGEVALAKFKSGEYTGFSIGGKLFKATPAKRKAA